MEDDDQEFNLYLDSDPEDYQGLLEDTLRSSPSEEVINSGQLYTLFTDSKDLNHSPLTGEHEFVSSECIKSTPEHVSEDMPVDIDVVSHSSASATKSGAETNLGLKVNLKRFEATSTYVEVNESSGGLGSKRQRYDESATKVPLPNVDVEPEDILASLQKVEFSNAKKFYAKDNFCSLCNTMQNRIDRHLITHHAESEGVKIINSLPKRSLERRRKFAQIVKSMNFVWNTDRTIDLEGHIIPTHRRRAPKSDSETTCKVASMIVCTHCLGFYARGSLHNHIRIQHPDKRNPDARTRVNAMRGEAMMKLCHERANLNEISELLAELSLDEVGAVARYDLLIILYANKYGGKHRTMKQRVYVRNNMRLLAKILIAAKNINGNIKDLASLLRVEHRQVLCDAIEAVAVIDHNTKRYGSIYNAEAAPVVIRKLFVILKAEYLSHKSTKGDHTDIVNFVDVFENEVAFLITYRASYTRKEQMRHRCQTELQIQPQHFEISRKFVEAKQLESKNYFEKSDFHDGLIREHHKNLTEITATSILNFNGRRPTETGGVLTKDYEFAKTESEYFKMLSKAEQQQRMKYKRMDMVGKKGSEGHLFINKMNDECLKLILRHRMDVGINISNPSLFAIPTHPGQEEQFVNLSPVYAKLAAQCKPYHPEIVDKAVRATKIRSHHATLNSAMENGTSVELMSKQLGHSSAMHESRYKERIDKTDVIVTKHLETMMGEAEEEYQPLPHISENSEILPEDSNSLQTASSLTHVEIDVHETPHTETRTALPNEDTKSKPAIKSIRR
ncbi:hypothetical protein QAD02_011880 [Eretmocerus hayati]|uniref:Uncharacterized protein n=1 Tax=Eretmocerus hayati TaxID=131215 RepID=A0ACC2NYE3_9HYME|nr:hypothetical protein QAD02_011880 [Eretmocerus hayati]